MKTEDITNTPETFESPSTSEISAGAQRLSEIFKNKPSSPHEVAQKFGLAINDIKTSSAVRVFADNYEQNQTMITLLASISAQTGSDVPSAEAQTRDLLEATVGGAILFGLYAADKLREATQN